MGLVYPWEMVRQGHVPTEADFVRVRSEIMGLLRGNRGLLHSASMVGSVCRGDFTPRSDIDLITVFADGRPEESAALVRQIRHLTASAHLTLDVHALTLSQARDPNAHHFGPSFKETFAGLGRSRCAVGPFTRTFVFSPADSVRDEMLRKTEHKLNSTIQRASHFRKICDDYGSLEDWLAVSWRDIKRPLRVHVTIARRVLWWRHGRLAEDGKDAVDQAFLGDPRLERYHSDFVYLRSLDQQYSRLLKGALKSQVDRRQYYLEVRDLFRSNFAASINLLRQLVSAMRADNESPFSGKEVERV